MKVFGKHIIIKRFADRPIDELLNEDIVVRNDEAPKVLPQWSGTVVDVGYEIAADEKLGPMLKAGTVILFRGQPVPFFMNEQPLWACYPDNIIAILEESSLVKYDKKNKNFVLSFSGGLNGEQRNEITNMFLAIGADVHFSNSKKDQYSNSAIYLANGMVNKLLRDLKLKVRSEKKGSDLTIWFDKKDKKIHYQTTKQEKTGETKSTTLRSVTIYDPTGAVTKREETRDSPVYEESEIKNEWTLAEVVNEFYGGVFEFSLNEEERPTDSYAKQVAAQERQSTSPIIGK